MFVSPGLAASTASSIVGYCVGTMRLRVTAFSNSTVTNLLPVSITTAFVLRFHDGSVLVPIHCLTR